MKKSLILALALITTVIFCGCSNNSAKETEPPVPVVVSPFAYPDYTFDKTPTTDELREMAVRAMRDILSIQWTPEETISYFNTAGRDKQFDYTPGKIYGGVLYSGAGSGLFQYLEYYNTQTGLLSYPGTGDELRKTIGSGCADSLLWSWGVVANSFSSGYYPSVMVQKNGYLPVGNYKYNEDISSYYLISTKDIIANNGEAVMLDAYTKVLPADAFISSSADHAMMVVLPPTVVYNDEGGIDTEASFVVIQDQRGGRTSTTFYEERESGQTIYYNSQRAMKMTFATLLQKNYIPVTLAEFIGTKAYEKAEVTTQGKTCKELKDLQNVMVESNYPIAIINVIAIDKKGNETEIKKILFHGANGEGPARSYNMSQVEELHTLETKNYKSIKIEVVVSTGERFIPVEIKL